MFLDRGKVLNTKANKVPSLLFDKKIKVYCLPINHIKTKLHLIDFSN